MNNLATWKLIKKFINYFHFNQIRIIIFHFSWNNWWWICVWTKMKQSRLEKKWNRWPNHTMITWRQCLVLWCRAHESVWTYDSFVSPTVLSYHRWVWSHGFLPFHVWYQILWWPGCCIWKILDYNKNQYWSRLWETRLRRRLYPGIANRGGRGVVPPYPPP